jgi:hypothetical protein
MPPRNAERHRPRVSCQHHGVPSTVCRTTVPLRPVVVVLHRACVVPTDTRLVLARGVCSYGTFATGGCDGLVFMWDGIHKKRICQLRKFHTSISSMAFNPDGSELAVAASYTFEEGEKEYVVSQPRRERERGGIYLMLDHLLQPPSRWRICCTCHRWRGCTTSAQVTDHLMS